MADVKKCENTRDALIELTAAINAASTADIVTATNKLNDRTKTLPVTDESAPKGADTFLSSCSSKDVTSAGLPATAQSVTQTTAARLQR